MELHIACLNGVIAYKPVVAVGHTRAIGHCKYIKSFVVCNVVERKRDGIVGGRSALKPSVNNVDVAHGAEVDNDFSVILVVGGVGWLWSLPNGVLAVDRVGRIV